MFLCHCLMALFHQILNLLLNFSLDFLPDFALGQYLHTTPTRPISLSPPVRETVARSPASESSKVPISCRGCLPHRATLLQKATIFPQLCTVESCLSILSCLGQKQSREHLHGKETTGPIKYKYHESDVKGIMQLNYGLSPLICCSRLFKKVLLH